MEYTISQLTHLKVQHAVILPGKVKCCLLPGVSVHFLSPTSGEVSIFFIYQVIVAVTQSSLIHGMLDCAVL